MNRKKQQFRELTPDRRPQDSHGDGIGLRFETGEHGGDYPDNMPQAITVTDAQGRWAVYVPLWKRGKVVPQTAFELPTCESWDMALTKSEARERALSYLRSLGPRDDYELVLLDDYTLEKPFGWVFFYDSKTPRRNRGYSRCSRGKCSGTPKDIFAKLNAAVIEALADAAVRQRLADLGLEIPSRDELTPESLGRLQRLKQKNGGLS